MAKENIQLQLEIQKLEAELQEDTNTSQVIPLLTVMYHIF